MICLRGILGRQTTSASAPSEINPNPIPIILDPVDDSTSTIAKPSPSSQWAWTGEWSFEKPSASINSSEADETKKKKINNSRTRKTSSNLAASPTQLRFYYSWVDEAYDTSTSINGEETSREDLVTATSIQQRQEQQTTPAESILEPISKTTTTNLPTPNASSLSDSAAPQGPSVLEDQTTNSDPKESTQTKPTASTILLLNEVPTRGHWRGTFDTLVGRKGQQTRNPVAEHFTLAWGGTTGAVLGEQTESAVSTHAANSADPTFSTGRTNSSRDIPVSGHGKNQYGTFGLEGSLNTETGLLQCTKTYVAGPEQIKSKSLGARKKTSKSHALSSSSSTPRPYQTRKRQMSWKRRAAYETVSTGDKTDPSVGSSTPVNEPPLKKRRVMDSGNSSGSNGYNDDDNYDGKTPHENEADAAVKQAELGSNRAQSLLVTIPDKLEGTALVASMQRGDNTSNSTIRRLLPMQHSAAPPTDSVAVNKKRASSAAGATASGTATASSGAAAGRSTHVSHATGFGNNNNNINSTNAPLVSQMKLPKAGEPVKARWRAAHFLYYHRNDPTAAAPTEGNNGTNNASNNNSSLSAPLAAASTPMYLVYEGEMLNSHRHGRGVCLYNNGMMYEGDWKRDKEHGIGSLMTADRKYLIYKGEWERGRMHGAGVYCYHDKINNKRMLDIAGECRYEGEFKENFRHGTGMYVLPDGSVYTGQWREGFMNGRGLFKWPDGSVYDGEWKDGKRHGLGLLKTSDGFTYDGAWIMNSMEGRGSASYPEGQQYNGLFSRGRREGRGTILFTNGAVYEGRFRDDAIDGQGTMKMSRTMVVPRRGRNSNNDFVPEDHAADNIAKVTELEIFTTSEGRDDFMIPVSFQSDMGHIHRKAGFTHSGT